MGDSQNITLRLDKETLRAARVLAASRGSSVSRLLSEYIPEMVGKEEAYLAAQAMALALLDQGFHLGGGRPAPREELHTR